MDPNFAIAHYELGQALVQKQMYSEAIAEFQRAIELAGNNAAFSSNLAYAYAVSGRREDALKIAHDLETRASASSAADSNVALIYAGLGDNDKAMIWLNKAYQARFNPSILLRPGFDPLRSDVRFQDLRRRIGLPLRLTSLSIVPRWSRTLLWVGHFFKSRQAKFDREDATAAI
jgi:tetratricopeptide (TPR) repeat protein